MNNKDEWIESRQETWVRNPDGTTTKIIKENGPKNSLPLSSIIDGVVKVIGLFAIVIAFYQYKEILNNNFLIATDKLKSDSISEFHWREEQLNRDAEFKTEQLKIQNSMFLAMQQISMEQAQFNQSVNKLNNSEELSKVNQKLLEQSHSKAGLVMLKDEIYYRAISLISSEYGSQLYNESFLDLSSNLKSKVYALNDSNLILLFDGLKKSINTLNALYKYNKSLMVITSYIDSFAEAIEKEDKYYIATGRTIPGFKEPIENPDFAGLKEDMTEFRKSYDRLKNLQGYRWQIWRQQGIIAENNETLQNVLPSIDSRNLNSLFRGLLVDSENYIDFKQNKGRAIIKIYKSISQGKLAKFNQVAADSLMEWNNDYFFYPDSFSKDAKLWHEHLNLVENSILKQKDILANTAQNINKEVIKMNQP